MVAPISNTENEESEWEYEYDETETETPALKKAAPQPQEAVPNPPENLQQTENQQQNGNIHEETSPIDPGLQDLPAPPNGHYVPPAAPRNPPDPQRRIQILDLHTYNPLISYNNRIYTCIWGSTLGTDLFLASPSSLSTITTKQTTITPL
ncbi:MAG: hypothetical protein Q9207_008119, partial [Kuettlingeria erythrocarpa]